MFIVAIFSKLEWSCTNKLVKYKKSIITQKGKITRISFASYLIIKESLCNTLIFCVTKAANGLEIYVLSTQQDVHKKGLQLSKERS